ncbi:MAG: hypothetical protein JKY92_07495 [Magnetovibrio sp.]|nr:hypothetical protein [Magnetovibrio sp.]
MAFHPSPSATSRIRPLHLGLAAVIVVVGFLVRLQGAFGELWFDEIWSLNAALGLDAWHEAFWKLPKDNNHPLNTWWLYMMGPGRAPWVYHFLSVTTGTVSIVVAGWIAARNVNHNRALRLLTAMALVAILYPFVNFGSEARGYGPMMLWALLAFTSIEPITTTAWQARWSYGIVGILGVLSHFAMLPILVALSVTFGVRQILNGHTMVQAFQATVRLNGPLIGGLLVIVSGIFYGVSSQNVLLGFGGSTLTCVDQSCFGTALDEMVRFSTGGFEPQKPGLFSGLYIITMIGSVAWLAAIGNVRALPLGLILVGIPALFYISGQPAIPHGRYFFAVFVFVPVLIVEVMAELKKRGRGASLLAMLSVVVLLAANGWAVKQFLATGRGDYAHALTYILKNSKPGPIDIATEVNVQLKTVMDFNQHLQAPERNIQIVKYKDMPQVKPPWLISVTIHTNHLPKTACSGKLLYTLVHGYGHWGMAGSTWGFIG